MDGLLAYKAHCPLKICHVRQRDRGLLYPTYDVQSYTLKRTNGSSEIAACHTLVNKFFRVSSPMSFVY